MFFQKRHNNYGQRSFFVHLITFVIKYFSLYPFHNVVTKCILLFNISQRHFFGPMKWSSHLIQGLKA